MSTVHRNPEKTGFGSCLLVCGLEKLYSLAIGSFDFMMIGQHARTRRFKVGCLGRRKFVSKGASFDVLLFLWTFGIRRRTVSITALGFSLLEGVFLRSDRLGATRRRRVVGQMRFGRVHIGVEGRGHSRTVAFIEEPLLGN
jgi:hypothetical protein